jgi:hypothetical protein
MKRAFPVVLMCLLAACQPAGDEDAGPPSAEAPAPLDAIAGSWATEAALCGERMWTVTAAKAADPGGGACVFTGEIRPSEGGWTVSAECGPPGGPATATDLHVRLGDPPTTLMFESPDIGGAVNLVRCPA